MQSAILEAYWKMSALLFETTPSPWIAPPCHLQSFILISYPTPQPQKYNLSDGNEHM